MTAPPPMRRVCVFSGSSSGVRPEYRRAAEALGQTLAARRIGLVYGGAQVGLMGAVADAALAAGGEVIGVIPEALVAKEIAHPGLTELRVVASMHQRKALMADLADAFIALPGGWGTLEEFFEVLTWAQLGLHRKPCGLLNVGGYFDGLLAFAGHAVAEGFVRPDHRELIVVAGGAAEMLERLGQHRPPPVEKWLDRAAT
ncbi:MAG TPA: TIGR00730 family Rossman fold protein [Pseudolysinimonas sp.]|nr:TIGR00730 family Rossman fold protein [Pseudolysinimonas sp.]